jgi:pyruvate/2-oxoglutarate dehydrogenase complex dihydrolipoamide acyltransferase (E2) component
MGSDGAHAPAPGATAHREPAPARAPTDPAGAPPATAGSPAAPPPNAAGAQPAPAVPQGAKQLRGAAALIAENMQASLEVPTATSIRVVPAKLLEVNRRIVNNQLKRTRGGKLSFTHSSAGPSSRPWARLRR